MYLSLEDRWSRIGEDYRYITSKEETLFYENYLHGNQLIFEEFALNDPRVKNLESLTDEFKNNIIVLIEKHKDYLKSIEQELLRRVNEGLEGDVFLNVEEYRKSMEETYRKAISKDPFLSGVIRGKGVRVLAEREARGDIIKDPTNNLFNGQYTKEQMKEIQEEIGVAFREALDDKFLDKAIIDVFRSLAIWYNQKIFDLDDKHGIDKTKKKIVEELIGKRSSKRGFLEIDKKEFREISKKYGFLTGVEFLISRFNSYTKSRKEMIHNTIMGGEAARKYGFQQENYIEESFKKGGVLNKYLPITIPHIKSKKKDREEISVQKTITDKIIYDLDYEMGSEKDTIHIGISSKLRIHQVVGGGYEYGGSKTKDVLSLAVKNKRDLNLFNYLKANYTALMGIDNNPWLKLEEELILLAMIPRFLDSNIKELVKNPTKITAIFLFSNENIFLISNILENLIARLRSGYKYERGSIKEIDHFKARVQGEKIVRPSTQKLWWEKIKILSKYSGEASIYKQFLGNPTIMRELETLNRVLRATSVQKVHYLIDPKKYK